MTIEEAKTWPKEYLTPAQVASITGQDPQFIRIAAREMPGRLPYPSYLSGKKLRSVKIPRRPFLKYMGVEVDD